MKWTVGLLLLKVAALGLAQPALALQPRPADPPVPWVASIEPFNAREISPAVRLLATPHTYFGPVVGNVTLIEQDDGLVVIDSGLTASHGRAVVAYARMISAKPIKAVAITHWHNDHPQGVSAIRDAFPNVRIIATAATEAGMLGPEATNIGYAPDPKFDAAIAKLVDGSLTELDALLKAPATTPDRRLRVRKALADYRNFIADFRGTYIVPPTDTFDRELLLDDPKTPVRLMHLGRANTDGDLVAWLPRQRIVVAGDIVVAPTPFGFFSYPGDWIETLGRLKALGFKTLIPGHGEPQHDSVYIDNLATAIADIRGQVGPLAKQGVPIDEVRKRVKFDKSAALFGDTPKIKANFEGLFVEPMIPNAYKEARGEPIVQGEGNPKPDYAHTPPEPSSRRH